MTLKFRFRKFIAPADYSVCGVSGLPDYPAFTTNTQYLTYNTLTGSGNLATTWNNAIVLYAKPTEEELQDYFKREWVEEDGIDVYAPKDRKRKAVKNEIEMVLYQPDKKALQSFDNIKNTLNGWGVFEYYDNYHKGLKRLIYEGYTLIADMSRNGMRVIHFRLICTNVLGHDIKNYNSSTGANLW